jgi:hypothetical protein
LSKRAARICVSAVSPLLTSTRPAAGSLRPVMTIAADEGAVLDRPDEVLAEAWPTAPAAR